MKHSSTLSKSLITLIAALVIPAGSAFAQAEPDTEELVVGGEQAPGAPVGVNITGCGAPVFYHLNLLSTGEPEPGAALINVTGSDKIQRLTMLTGIGTGTVTGTSLLETGATAPDTGGATFKSFYDPITDSSSIVNFGSSITIQQSPTRASLRAKLTGAGVIPANDEAVFHITPAGVSLIAREGDAVAGMDGHTISKFKAVAARAGEVAVTVTATKLLPTGKKENRTAVIKRRAGSITTETLTYEGQLRRFRGNQVVVEKLVAQTVIPGNNSDNQWNGPTLRPAGPDFTETLSLPLLMTLKKIQPEPPKPGGGPAVYTRYRVVSLEK